MSPGVFSFFFFFAQNTSFINTTEYVNFKNKFKIIIKSFVAYPTLQIFNFFFLINYYKYLNDK